jgi:mono/diheme cytochrome c family protein
MVLVALLAALLVGAALPTAAQTPADRPLTYSKDVAPIFQRSCVRCHRPDSIAPMSLMTYQEVRPWARAIKQRTQLAYVPGMRGVMPPWLLERNIGIQAIQQDLRLTDDEIATIAKWVDSGAPEGNAADLPPAIKFADSAEWIMGKPDLVVSSPKFLVPGVAPDWWGDLDETPSVEALTVDRYAERAEYKESSSLTKSTGLLKRSSEAPGQGKTSIFVVHHGGAHMRRPDEDREISSIPNHEVGHNGHIFPAQAGKLIPAKAVFTWPGMHIHSPGVPGADREVTLNVGLKLHPLGYKPLRKEGRVNTPRSELDINPYSTAQRYDSYFVAQQPLKLLNFEPHMHAAGLRMCIEAIYELSVETLSCAGYDHNWVRDYRYDEDHAPLIPKGTIVHTISWFDGTRRNANLVDPRNTTVWGRRSVENMLGVNNYAFFLTDEQYKEELAQRRDYLNKTNGWETLIGCPDCWKSPNQKPRAPRRGPLLD